ncbi:MAG: NAD-dependent epimerase/dehydratase family protein [Gammaproteobacteria bacterium]|nr:NAD-dependent epimerase/dehydratase family protein [Gammaproteobacteria bacterium]
MTILVTGANGFIGAAVIRALLSTGQRVRALVRPGSDRSNLDGVEVDAIDGDVTVIETLDAAMMGCRFVFHVAADYRLWVPDPEPMYATNVQGSMNVIEAAARASVEKLVYTSSVAVLGANADGTPADEETPVAVTDMIGHYKRSKYLAEEAVGKRAHELGLAVITVNPSTPIGPGDIKPTPTGRIILDAAAGRMPAYVDTGLNVVHVDDVACGHLLALKFGTPGQRYILGGTDLSLREILTLVASRTGRSAPAVRLPHWFVTPIAYMSEGWARLTGSEPRVSVAGVRMSAKRMYFSSAKAVRELGYRSRPPEEAIAAAVGWFREHNYL